MKTQQLNYILNSHILNGSCPRIFPHPRKGSAGGPPSSATRSCKALLSTSLVLLIPFILIIALLSSTSILVDDTSALTYQNNTPVNFTFNPSINISLSSSDLIIEDLSPGSSNDSNIINIEVGTNNITGYTLSASVGNGTTYTNTNLIDTHDPNNNDTFTSLATNASISGVSNINPGYWGYSYSVDNGTTWSNYSGLPYYSSGSNKELASSSDNGISSIKFKIGANANTWQMAGEYNNVINFYATTNLPPPYMQEATMSDCGKIMMDKRDTKIYTTALINGQCWMTQNLRVTGTISAEYSNFTGNDFNVSEYSLDANDASYANHCDSTNGYNYACTKDSGSDTTGVWYNYYSATAGTIGTNNNTNPATQDICPAGWRLPTGPNTVEGTDFNKLIGNTTSGWQPATSGLSAFAATAGGDYYYGSLGNIKRGRWWSATGESSTFRVSLLYSNDVNQFSGNFGYERFNGAFLRCVMNDN